MENQREDKMKRKIVSIILLVFLILVVIGVTYSVFIYGKEGINNNTLSTSSIIFTYDETTNGIALENAMPIEDEIGKKMDKNEDFSGYFDFNVGYNTSANRAVNYEIYATPIFTENQLDSKYVKIYLTDQNDVPIYNDDKVKVFSELEDSSVDNKSKKIFYGSFTKSESKKFRIRLWVSKDYPIDNISRNFKIKINVDASES